MKKAKTVILLFIAGIAINTNAQTIINVTGNSSTIAGNVYEYNVGELAAITTLTNPNIIITQGLLQPASNTVGINEPHTKNPIHFTLFPNPSQDVVNLQMTEGESGTVAYCLYNNQGQKVLEKSFAISTSNIEPISIENLSAGNYYLHIQFSNAVIKSKNQSFKIQKIN